MADSAIVRKVPCPVPGCDGAGDNATEYDDGSVKCHACGAKWLTEEEYEQALGGSEGAEVEGSASSPGKQGSPLDFVFTPHVQAFKRLGLSRATCERYGYGLVEHAGETWQAAPYRDQTGRQVAWKIRNQDKEFLFLGDGDRALTFFGQHLQSEGKRLVLTEGEKDALAGSQILGNRWPVWSIRHGAGSAAKEVAANLGALEKFDQVVLAFDMDEAGRQAAEECAPLLTPGKVCIATYPLKDLGDMLRDGRENEAKTALWSAPTWEPGGMLEGDDLLAAIKGKWRPPIVEYPYPELQRMTRGVREAEIVLLVSASGGGKSTVARTLAWNWAHAGVKVGVLTLEETVDQFMVPFVGYEMGKNLRLSGTDPTEDPEFDAAFARVSEKVVAYDDDGARDPDTIFDLVRYMKLARGCDIIFLDHLTVILGGGRSKGEDGMSFTDRLMSRLETLIKRTRATLVLVTHLRKVGTQSRSHSAGSRVTLDDVKGSSLIGDLSHTVIARERDHQKNDGGHFRLLKCRLSGTGELGECDKLRFVKETGMVVADLMDPAERFLEAKAEEALESYTESLDALEAPCVGDKEEMVG